MDRVESENYCRNEMTKCTHCGENDLVHIVTEWTNSKMQKFCRNCEEWSHFSFWPNIKNLTKQL